MNNEQQTWILKPGHEILNGKDNDYEWTALVKPGEDVTTGFCSTISTTIWEKHFMPLNVSGLTRQVEEIVVRGLARSANREKIRQNAPTGTPLLEKRAYELYGEPVIDTIEMVEAILELLLNQEGETK